MSFMKHVQIDKPSTMDELTISKDMSGSPILPLNNGNTVPIVPSIAPAPWVSRLTFWGDVKITPIFITDGTSLPLKIAAPSISFSVCITPIWPYMVKSVMTMNGNPPEN